MWRCGVMRTVVFVCALLCGLPAGADSLDALYESLDAQGITYDREQADAAAIGAALAIVDPRASMVVLDATNAVASTNAPKLVAERWEQDIGYLGITSLTDEIAADIVVQTVAWDAGGIQGVILDLRGSGGESLAAVDRVAGLVATNGTPLYNLKDLKGRVLERHAVASSSCCSLPLMVLTDRETHDASEVLAAALQKHGGVMLVGSRTLGDATVRHPLPISENLAVVVACGKVCLGESCNYDGEGVAPDVPVAESWVSPSIDTSSQEGLNGRPMSEKALEDRELMKRIEADIVLRRAADILLGLKALGDSSPLVPVVSEPVEPEDVRPEDK